MNIQKKQLDNQKVELTVRVPKADASVWLAQAAARMSAARPLKGFRPGKAPYDMVKREFGEAAILSEALEDIINATIAQALDQEKLATYGRMEFNLLPAAPDEAVAYKAMATLMPTVSLGKWQTPKIKREEVKVSDAELTQAVDELAAMMTAEEIAARPAQMGDKAVVDFEVKVDEKVIEGGTAQDFALVLGEGRMIPGFEEKVVGAKSGETVEFNLNFPEKYQAAHLAGKPAQFKIAVKQVLTRVKPNIDDEFAKRVGVENLAALKVRLQENIEKEKREKEEERVEIAAIKQLNQSATFSDLPAEMIGETAHDLVHEFEHSLVHQGMKFDQYLQSVGKKEADLIKDFEPKAVERIKSAMALGQLAEDEQVAVTPEEVEAEIVAQKIRYANNAEAMQDINRPEYRRHVANSLINRKLIDFLKSKLVE